MSQPDNDHIAGIRHLVNGEIGVENMWDLPNTKTCDSFANDYAELENECDRENWLHTES